MHDALLRLYVRHTFGEHRVRRDDRGEGVISAAIAVLIVAFLGVAVWAGFSAAVKSSSDKVNANVDKIGTAP
jgi:Flp pilus assembly pilin Flp